MPSLLLRLAGPMQSWGTASRFDERDTGREPSKSGVLGLVAAALGVDRDNWNDLEPLTRLSLTVRHDRPGIPGSDFQTAGCAATDAIIKADGKQAKGGGVVSRRHFLADAVFLAILSGEDPTLLLKVHAALQNPVWPLALGRKSYVPSEHVWLDAGLQHSDAVALARTWPWLGRRRPWETLPARLLVSADSSDGSGALRMDHPIGAFGERRFGARMVRTEWIPFPGEAADVAA